MSQSLPSHHFEWMPPHHLHLMEQNPFRFLDVLTKEDQGYIFEVDLSYPPPLHTKHNDYPLAPERLNIKQNWLSEEQREIRTHYDMKVLANNRKLIPHFLKREKYVIHHEALKF